MKTILKLLLAVCATALFAAIFATSATAYSYGYVTPGYYSGANYYSGAYYGNSYSPYYYSGAYYSPYSYGWSGWSYNRVRYNYHYPYYNSWTGASPYYGGSWNYYNRPYVPVTSWFPMVGYYY